MNKIKVSISFNETTATIESVPDPNTLYATTYGSDLDELTDMVDRAIRGVGFIPPPMIPRGSSDAEKTLGLAFDALEEHVEDPENCRGLMDYVDRVNESAKTLVGSRWQGSLDKTVIWLCDTIDTLEMDNKNLREDVRPKGFDAFEIPPGTFAWAAIQLERGRSVRRRLGPSSFQKLVPDQQNDIVGADDFNATNWELAP